MGVDEAWKETVRAFFWLIVLLVVINLLDYLGDEYRDKQKNAAGYVRTTDIESKVQVIDEKENGNLLLINERITFDIYSANKENLHEELKINLVGIENNEIPVKYKILSVNDVSDGNYQEYTPYEWKKKLKIDNNLKIIEDESFFIQIEPTYRDKLTFEVEYLIMNPVAVFEDCSELKLSFGEENSNKFLNSLDVEILIPNKNMPSENNYRAMTFGTVNSIFSLEEDKNLYPEYNTFVINLEQSELKFNNSSSELIFDLVAFGDDKESFSKNAISGSWANENMLDEINYWHQESLKTYDEHENTKKIILYSGFIILIFLVCHTFTTNSRIRLKYKFYKSPVEYKEFKSIPSQLDPIFVASLISCKSKEKKIIKGGNLAILFSLAKKNKIELTRFDTSKRWIPTNIVITIKNNKLEGSMPKLSSIEKFYYDLIFEYSKGESITLAAFKLKIEKQYGEGDLFISKIEESNFEIGMNEGYFQEKYYTKIADKLNLRSNLYKKLGIIILIIPNIILYNTYIGFANGIFFYLSVSLLINSIYLKHIANRYVLLTKFGEIEYEKWNGLYRYLKSDKFLKETIDVDVETWEQYLIYGAAFGLFERVIKVLKFKCNEKERSSLISNVCFYSEKVNDTPRIENIRDVPLLSTRHITNSLNKIDWDDVHKSIKKTYWDFFFGWEDIYWDD